MEREYALGLHKIDVANQIIVIGVIGKRKGGIDLITINRIGIDCPAAQHRDAFARNFFQHARAARAGRANENFSGHVAGLVTDVFTKRLAELLVNARHLKNGAMQHGRKAGAVE